MHQMIPRRLALVLCAALMAAVGCRTNPVTGGSEFVVVSPAEELALGDQMHPNVVFMYDGQYNDPELTRYLGTIVMRLHACSHRPEMPVDFLVLNTSVVNAFATPGHVYATRGFLARVANEGQFASVMGHELSHVAAGHSAKELTNRLVTNLAFGVADYAAGESLTGQLTVGAGQASVALLGLSYSREQEIQADRVGAYYMALAGWDPRQAVEMERALASLGQRNPTVLDRYLSTHPPSEQRIAEIESVIVEKRLDSRGSRQGDGVYAERWEQHLRQLREVDRAFAPYDRGMKSLAAGKFAEARAAADEAVAARPDQAQFYRLAGDALLGLDRPAEAKAAYRDALTRDRRYVPANIGLGRASLREGDYAAAESEFAIAAHGYPGSVTAWYGLGAARYGQRKYSEAVEPLEKAAGALPKDPMVHYMLAVCYDETGRYADAKDSYVRALNAGLSGTERQHAVQRVAALGLLLGVAPD